LLLNPKKGELGGRRIVAQKSEKKEGQTSGKEREGERERGGGGKEGRAFFDRQVMTV